MILINADIFQSIKPRIDFFFFKADSILKIQSSFLTSETLLVLKIFFKLKHVEGFTEKQKNIAKELS